MYLYDGSNRLKSMVGFLKQVLKSEEELELPDYVEFSSLVTIEDSPAIQSDSQLPEYLSALRVRACAFNIKETQLFHPFRLQDELVNLADLMLHEHETGVKRIEGFDPLRQSSTNTVKNAYIAHFERRLRDMLEGTSRVLSEDNIHNRVLAAMYLMHRPRVLSAMSMLTRRPLQEYFISSQRAWLTKRSGRCSRSTLFVCEISLPAGLAGCRG